MTMEQEVLDLTSDHPAVSDFALSLSSIRWPAV